MNPSSINFLNPNTSKTRVRRTRLVQHARTFSPGHIVSTRGLDAERQPTSLHSTVTIVGTAPSITCGHCKPRSRCRCRGPRLTLRLTAAHHNRRPRPNSNQCSTSPAQEAAHLHRRSPRNANPATVVVALRITLRHVIWCWRYCTVRSVMTVHYATWATSSDLVAVGGSPRCCAFSSGMPCCWCY